MLTSISGRRSNRALLKLSSILLNNFLTSFMLYWKLSLSIRRYILITLPVFFKFLGSTSSQKNHRLILFSMFSFFCSVCHPWLLISESMSTKMPSILFNFFAHIAMSASISLLKDCQSRLTTIFISIVSGLVQNGGPSISKKKEDLIRPLLNWVLKEPILPFYLISWESGDWAVDFGVVYWEHFLKTQVTKHQEKP